MDSSRETYPSGGGTPSAFWRSSGFGSPTSPSVMCETAFLASSRSLPTEKSCWYRT
jgi:hypothetical protein